MKQPMSNMPASQFRHALDLLAFGPGDFAAWIDCDVRMVRRWMSGDMLIPSRVADWVKGLVIYLEKHPRPQLRGSKTETPQ
jgi:hypothetical protein